MRQPTTEIASGNLRSRLSRQARLTVRGGTTVHEFLRFCVVGATNTGIDFGAYLALTRLFDFWSQRPVSAAAISWLLAVSSSFVLNNFWTFGRGAGGLHGRAGRFVAVAAGGGILNLAVMAALIRWGAHDIVAKVIATVAVTAWNFFLQKKWTFGPRKAASDINW
ncbi:MAG: GtrA family protein [bacterium]